MEYAVWPTRTSPLNWPSTSRSQRPTSWAKQEHSDTASRPRWWPAIHEPRVSSSKLRCVLAWHRPGSMWCGWESSPLQRPLIWWVSWERISASCSRPRTTPCPTMASSSSSVAGSSSSTILRTPSRSGWVSRGSVRSAPRWDVSMPPRVRWTPTSIIWCGPCVRRTPSRASRSSWTVPTAPRP